MLPCSSPCSSIYFLQGGTQVEDACTFEGWCQVDDDYKDEIEVDCDLMQYIDACEVIHSNKVADK